MTHGRSGRAFRVGHRVGCSRRASARCAAVYPDSECRKRADTFRPIVRSEGPVRRPARGPSRSLMPRDKAPCQRPLAGPDFLFGNPDFVTRLGDLSGTEVPTRGHGPFRATRRSRFERGRLIAAPQRGQSLQRQNTTRCRTRRDGDPRAGVSRHSRDETCPDGSRTVPTTLACSNRHSPP